MRTVEVVFSGEISASSEVSTFPTGEQVIVQTDAEIGIAFWNVPLGDYGQATTISDTVSIIPCPCNKAEITTATTANVHIVVLKQEER